MNINEYLDRQLFSLWNEYEYKKSVDSSKCSDIYNAVKSKHDRKKNYKYGKTTEHLDLFRDIAGAVPIPRWYYICQNNCMHVYNGKELDKIVSEDMLNVVVGKKTDNAYNIITEDPVMTIMKFGINDNMYQNLNVIREYPNSVLVIPIIGYNDCLETQTISVPIACVINRTARDFIHSTLRSSYDRFELVRYLKNYDSYLHGATLDITRNINISYFEGSTNSMFNIACGTSGSNTNVKSYLIGGRLAMTTADMRNSNWYVFMSDCTKQIRHQIFTGLFENVDWVSVERAISDIFSKSSVLINLISSKTEFLDNTLNYFTKENCIYWFNNLLADYGMSYRYQELLSRNDSIEIAKSIMSIK